MESYTPPNKELLENRIEHLKCQCVGYKTKIKENEIEIKRLEDVYNEKYPQPYEYNYIDTGNPWAN